MMDIYCFITATARKLARLMAQTNSNGQLLQASLLLVPPGTSLLVPLADVR